MPVIIEYTYADGTTELQRKLIERYEIKLIRQQTAVVGIVIDPNRKLQTQTFLTILAMAHEKRTKTPTFCHGICP
jgi:hypothetical protein